MTARTKPVSPLKHIGKSVKRDRLNKTMSVRKYAACAGVEHTMVLRLEQGHDILLSSWLKLSRSHGLS